MEAASVCKEAIESNPKSAPAHYVLALALEKLGLAEPAALEHRAAMELERNRYHVNIAHQSDLHHSYKDAERETAANLNAEMIHPR